MDELTEFMALKMYLKIVLQMFFNTLLENYVSVADLIQ